MSARRCSARTCAQTHKYSPSWAPVFVFGKEKSSTQKLEEALMEKASVESVSLMLAKVSPGDEVCHVDGNVWKVKRLGDKTVRLEGVAGGPDWGLSASVFARMLFGREPRPDKALAFAMGSHSRLGGGSLLASLSMEVFRAVCSITTGQLLSLVDNSPAPIPVNLRLRPDCSPIAIEAPRGKRARKWCDKHLRKWSAIEKKLEATLDEWRWKPVFDSGSGFGTITPPTLSLHSIFALAIPQLTDGFTPTTPDTAHDFPALKLRIRQSCNTVVQPSAVLKAYTRACKRGDLAFDLVFERIWTCDVLPSDDDALDSDSDGWS